MNFYQLAEGIAALGPSEGRCVDGEAGEPAFPGSAAGKPAPRPAPGHPTTNRGDTVTGEEGKESACRELDFHPDYLSFSSWAPFQVVLGLVGARLLNLSPWDNVDDQFRELEHGARGFGRVLLGPGVTIYADPVQAKESFVHVEVKGQGLEGVPLEEVIALLGELEDSGCRWQCSRLDLAWDHCGFSPATVNDAARRGDVRVPFKRRAGWRKFIDSAEAEPGCEGDDDGGQAGQTCYLGTAKSPRQLCVYNRRGFTRCEFRLRGDRASAVLRDLLTYESHRWSARAMEHLCDFVSFIDVTDDSCISRCEPLSWWQAFIGDAKRAALRLPRSVPKVFESASVKRKRASREAAIQAEVFGVDFVVEEIKRAGKLLSDEDLRRSRVLAAAVRKVAEDLGDDVARGSCWPEPSAADVLRSWGREKEKVPVLS